MIERDVRFIKMNQEAFAHKEFVIKTELTIREIGSRSQGKWFNSFEISFQQKRL